MREEGRVKREETREKRRGTVRNTDERGEKRGGTVRNTDERGEKREERRDEGR